MQKHSPFLLFLQSPFIDLLSSQSLIPIIYKRHSLANQLIIIKLYTTTTTQIIFISSKQSHQMTEQTQQMAFNLEPEKQYILQDIMRKRKKDEEAVMNKIKSKIELKNKRKSKDDVIKPPEKFIKEYRAKQRSYAHYKQQNKKIHTSQAGSIKKIANGKLLVLVRIRGVKDISKQQSLTLNKLGLRQVNTAVFVKVTKQLLTTLKTVENYITWGEPSKKIVSELFYKKAYGKVNSERVQINSNEIIEKQIGGDILCFEDIINEVLNVGKQFEQIKQFIYPFKLTTPEGLLMSRLRKPVGKDGHWGYRGEEINDFIEAMI